MKIEFMCGCFLSAWIEPEQGIKSALSCCEEHEFPEANLHFFNLAIDDCHCDKNKYQTKEFAKAGYHGMCMYCKKPVITLTKWANYFDKKA